MYTGDIYNSNSVFSRYFLQKEVPPLPPDHWQRSKSGCPIVGLATYVERPAKQQLVIDGHDVNLTKYRQELLLRGHERMLLDIYGRGWPKGFVRGSSRQKDWHMKKKAIMDPYLFNVAMENTNWPYYCTEKIWDAIEGGCLPIYWGTGNSIYEDFPQDSFLDYSNYSGPNELLDHVKRMGEIEYRERMGRCIKAHNSIFRELSENQSVKQILDRFAVRVWQIVRGASGSVDDS
jgi:hypothetical protein